jgi:hypothetical protein
MNKKAAGYSLLELLLWISAVAIIMGLSIKTMFHKKPLDNISYLISELNNISMLASERAMSGKVIVRLLITPKPGGGFKVDLNELSKNNDDSFSKVTDLFIPTNLDIVSLINVKKIVSQSDIDENENNKIESFFLPSGFCEELSISLTRKYESDVVEVKLLLNRLLCRFEIVK